MSDYDSAADTLRHINRVATLMTQPITELITRAPQHDASKLNLPEKHTFDRMTPRLATTTYGTPEYAANLAEMKPALDHHYAHNRHHPEHFGAAGVNGMTLVDLIEMLADWKAATERHAEGSLKRSLAIQASRFNLSAQTTDILTATARHFGWLDCAAEHTAPDGTKMRCNRLDQHPDNHVDGHYEPYDWAGQVQP
jgi:hypothetical protein